MTLTQVWGCLIILIFCPILGALPLINWITYVIKGHKLSQLGTGNISVSAAFYHGGRLVGILAVISEASKGIISVLLARAFFPTGSLWELIALIALVMGRYWGGKGAGTTNVVWGIVVHDAIAALLIFLISFVGFTIFRERKMAKLSVLFLLASILVLRHPQHLDYIISAIALAGLLGWIYVKIPDDLDLPMNQSSQESQGLFRFFQGGQGILTLNQVLNPEKVGNKAANLSQLKAWGYDVPDGWILVPGDDIEQVVGYLRPTSSQPLIVRSSASGEDSLTASAAGQYLSMGNITNQNDLRMAIFACLTSYNYHHAVEYRQNYQESGEGNISVLIQKQISGIFSGVAFSRDPVDPLSEDIVIEAMAGGAESVVSGKVTPLSYRVPKGQLTPPEPHYIGAIPSPILDQVACICREIEAKYHGIPQDLEWTYDGDRIWILQTRPISNMQPIWTSKIAAEVIPGVIRPLTWSINHPLTCGIWGALFELVLGKAASGFDWQEMATLHYHRAYFNASLLGAIFLRMGLPPESLEFLTRDAKMTKPPLWSTVRNLPGLWRLLVKERSLVKDFRKAQTRLFIPLLQELERENLAELTELKLLKRINRIMDALKPATYYSILAPLSFAIRQGILQVKDHTLDYSQIPEVASVRAIAQLAATIGTLLPPEILNAPDSDTLFDQIKDNQDISIQFEQLIQEYSYLSEVATDIAIPRWREHPDTARELCTQFLLNPESIPQKPTSAPKPSWQTRIVQQRLNLKGQVNMVYSQLLAHLRWSFLALEQMWLSQDKISSEGDIFFLTWQQINSQKPQDFKELIAGARSRFDQAQNITHLPKVIYGNPPAPEQLTPPTPATSRYQLQGIGASPGIVEGKVLIMRKWTKNHAIDSNTILVVPYTDAGWSAVIARAGGIIAEVGGRLSHGAIIARESGIPAVMDIHNATYILHNGQPVRLDGQRGIVEILNS